MPFTPLSQLISQTGPDDGDLQNLYSQALSQATASVVKQTQENGATQPTTKEPATASWLSQDAIASLSLPEDQAQIITKPDVANRESDRTKQNAAIKEQFSSLNIPLKSKFLQETRTREVSMTWQERTAYAHHCKILGGPPTVVERQKQIRARESATKETFFDMQSYEAYRLTPQDTIRKTSNGHFQLCRSPLSSLITGLNQKTKDIVQQTFPERIGAMVKGLSLADTHKKLEMEKWRIASLKQFVHFHLHSTSLHFNLYQGLLRQGAFTKMGAIGSLFAQSMGLLVLEDIKTNEAIIKCLSKENTHQLDGKRYLDLHPGSASKDWYSKEQQDARALHKIPMPHPQCNYNDWLAELKKLGYGKNKTKSPAVKGLKRPLADGPNPNPKKKKKTGTANAAPFWKRHAWNCKACKTKHPKGHFCQAGIDAGKPNKPVKG